MSTYKPLQSIVLTSTVTSVTFSGVDQTYTDLVLVSSPIFEAAASSYGPNFMLNGDTGSNYTYTLAYGNGSATGSFRQSRSRWASGGGYPNPEVNVVHFQDYSNSTAYKTILARVSGPTADTSMAVNLWSSISPITSITLYGSDGTKNFLAGSTFALYGIRAGTPKATGGDVVTTDGTYWYHAFKNTSAFTVQQDSSLTVDYLIVAGGGGGGGGIAQNYSGSGGGAGGVRLLTSQSLAGGRQYPVTIGAGGSGAFVGTSSSTNGGNTTFNGSSVTGGGKGTNGASGAGSGGSGGAASAEGSAGAGNSGSYTPVEGYAGGVGYLGGSNKVPAGGGGGAGGAGGNASDGVGGNGGAGTNAYNAVTFTSWLSATGTGSSGYVAGGGGGGSRASGTAGSSGSGGGGAGAVASSTSISVPGNNATANTGSGGGGGGPASSGSDNRIGGNGASGLVIVRYSV